MTVKGWVIALSTVLGGLGGTATVLHYFRIDPPWVKLALTSWRFPTKAAKALDDTKVWGPGKVYENEGVEFAPGAVVTYCGYGYRYPGPGQPGVLVAYMGITSAQGVALVSDMTKDDCGYSVHSCNANSLQINVDRGAGVPFLIGRKEFTLTITGIFVGAANVVVRSKPE